MSAILYDFLPTEIVWKIYEDLHKSYTRDLNEELLNTFCYARDRNTPFLCMIGECDCYGDEYGEDRQYYRCYCDYEWDNFLLHRPSILKSANIEMNWMENNPDKSIDDYYAVIYADEENMIWETDSESEDED